MWLVWPVLMFFIGIAAFALGIEALTYGLAALVLVLTLGWVVRRTDLAIRRHRGRSREEVARDIHALRTEMTSAEERFTHAAEPFADAVFNRRVAAEMQRRIDAGVDIDRQVLVERAASLSQRDRLLKEVDKDAHWPHRRRDFPMAFELHISTRPYEQAAYAWVETAVNPKRSLAGMLSAILGSFTTSPLEHPWTAEMTQAAAEYMDLYRKLRDLELELASLEPNREHRERIRTAGSGARKVLSQH